MGHFYISFIINNAMLEHGVNINFRRVDMAQKKIMMFVVVGSGIQKGIVSKILL